MCLSTSAAPTYLPPHYFETMDAQKGTKRTFDLIDGGVAANNPVSTINLILYPKSVLWSKLYMYIQTLMGITQLSRQILTGSFKAVDMSPMDSNKTLVLSLGTGIPKNEEKFNAATASKWGLLSWVYNGGGTPIIDVFSDASSDMVDIHVSTLYQSVHSEKNYLRIQVFI